MTDFSKKFTSYSVTLIGEESQHVFENKMKTKSIIPVPNSIIAIPAPK